MDLPLYKTQLGTQASRLCVLVDDMMITISQLICICTKDMIRDVTSVTWRQIHSGDI